MVFRRRCIYIAVAYIMDDDDEDDDDGAGGGESPTYIFLLFPAEITPSDLFESPIHKCIGFLRKSVLIWEIDQAISFFLDTALA